MVSAKICFIENRTYYNHYRPMVKIRDDNMYNSCELIFKNRNSVCSGEEIEVTLNFLVKELITDYLYKGKRFLIYEGQKIVGQGEIISI
jgi:translation elongation factor EF-Tu-like GTPase